MTTVHTWPEAWSRYTNARFDLLSSSKVSGSPWSGRQSVYGPHAQIWKAEVTLTTQREEEHAAIAAFFDQVGGRAGLIRLRHPTRTRPLYDADVTQTSENFSDGTNFTDGTGFAGTVLPALINAIEAADRGATNMIVGGDGLPTSTSRVLRAGDCFEIRRNGIADHVPSFHRVARDAPTDADGHTGIKFYPSLRKAVAAGDQIVLRDPTCVFRLTDDEQGRIDISPPTLGDLGFSLVEALV